MIVPTHSNLKNSFIKNFQILIPLLLVVLLGHDLPALWAYIIQHLWHYSLQKYLHSLDLFTPSGLEVLSAPKERILHPIANAIVTDAVVVELVDPETLKALYVNKSGLTFMYIRTWIGSLYILNLGCN
jgi:hypothetical protein